MGDDEVVKKLASRSVTNIVGKLFSGKALILNTDIELQSI